MAVGELRERGLVEAAGEYRKRLSRYCKLEEVEVPTSRRPEPERRRSEEAERIEKACQATDAVMLLDPGGTRITSPGLAELLGSLAVGGQGRVAWVIGGPDGLAPTLKARATRILSFSDLTFPHQLFRVMLMEQIYRAFTIGKGEPYHR